MLVYYCREQEGSLGVIVVVVFVIVVVVVKSSLQLVT